MQRLVAAGVPLAAASFHGGRAPAACAAAEPHRGLPLVDVRLHAHQLLFGRFLLAAAEEVRPLPGHSLLAPGALPAWSTFFFSIPSLCMCSALVQVR